MNGVHPPRIAEALGINSSTFKMIQTGGPNCPNLIYCVWKSGRHAVLNLTCKSWKCVNCAKIKVNEMTQLLADATIGNELLHEIHADEKQLRSISLSMRRKGLSCLSIKFTNGVYILTSDEVGGRGWKSDPILRLEAIVKVNSVDVFRIKRRDFTHDWRPEATYEPTRDTVIISKRFETIKEARDRIALFGQDLNSELITGDPLDLMERMLKAGGELR